MTCATCGRRNAPGTPFCDSCGAFLDWEDERGPEAPATVPVADSGAAPVADAGTAPVAAPATAPVRDSGTGPAQAPPPALPAPTPAPVSRPVPRTAPEAVPPPSAARPVPQTAPEVVPPPPASRPVPPPSAALPASVPHPPPPPAAPVEAVAPAGPRRPGVETDEPAPGPPPDTPPPESVEDSPAEPVASTVRCPGCGTGNEAARTLCVRCALPLAPGPVPAATPPWWRRLPRRRGRQAPLAGTRPRRSRRRPRIVLPLVLVLLAAGLWFGLPHAGRLLGLAREETSPPESLPPSAVRASRSLKDHPATAAFDGFSNRYWAAPEPGATLEADFPLPGVRVTKLVVFAGTSAKKDEFLTQARPARILVELVSADGDTRTRRLTLKDQPGQQTLTLRGSKVTHVRITPETAYGTARGRHLALAEVEFFGHRG
ncbi:NADase-type glycan-binding domain-containing protein [Streptomyces sp. NPDC014861]|uniref:NADase-type glycan-binding domain-containing protein n=1 Tax=Streptomyces sp. NPDC014861 TaxID=3364923 RepID=UPI0036FB181C